MIIKPNLRKTAEFGISMTILSALILAGCGGGSSGSSSTTNTPTASSITTTIVPFKGKYSTGTVTLKDAAGNTVTTGTIASNGTATVTLPATTVFPLVVEVTGTYQNEATGANETSTTPVRSFIADATAAAAASGVPVTAVTEVAVAGLEKKIGGSLIGIKAASAVAEFSAAETLLGLASGDAMKPPVFDANGKTSDANTLKLAALAVSAQSNGTGADLVAKLKKMAIDMANLSAASAPSANPVLAGLAGALTSITSGASSVIPAGVTAPTGIAFNVPASSVQAIQSAVAAATASMVANSSAADNFIATATSTGGLHEGLWVTGEPASGVAAVDFKQTYVAGSTAGSYSASSSARELTNGGWVTKTPATATYPSYYMNANTTGWLVDSGSFTLQKNADGSLTITHPRMGVVTATVQELNVSGQAIIDPATGIPTSSLYPTGSKNYVTVGGRGSIAYYRIFVDTLHAVTDLNGTPLATISTTTSFCTQGSVFKPLNPAAASGDNYNVYFVANCTAGGIAGAAATPDGTVLITTKNTGNSGVSSVFIVKASANQPWLVDSIVGSVNGNAYSGVFKNVGANVGILNRINKIAADAELKVAFPNAPALP